MVVLSLFPIMLLLLYDLSSFVRMMIYLLVISLAVWLYFIAFDKKVEINDTSVMFKSFRKRQELSWEQIKEVGVVYYSPTPLATTVNFLCFSTVKGYCGKRIFKFSDEHIYIRNREGLNFILQRYWNKEIIEY
jgi:hypothetical protein